MGVKECRGSRSSRAASSSCGCSSCLAWCLAWCVARARRRQASSGAAPSLFPQLHSVGVSFLTTRISTVSSFRSLRFGKRARSETSEALCRSSSRSETRASYSLQPLCVTLHDGKSANCRACAGAERGVGQLDGGLNPNSQVIDLHFRVPRHSVRFKSPIRTWGRVPTHSHKVWLLQNTLDRIPSVRRSSPTILQHRT